MGVKGIDRKLVLKNSFLSRERHKNSQKNIIANEKLAFAVA